jgi:hypothetical protein
MVRSEHQYEQAKELAEYGCSDYEISRATGVPRATVQRWRHREHAPHSSARLEREPWAVVDPTRYCYLLGVYLGDGHITHRPPNGWALHIAADRAYPNIIDEVMLAMSITFPGGRPTKRPGTKGAADVVSICARNVPLAFPQHGPGRKHLRSVVLVDWQHALTRAHPEPLIRGLIHSDGCRSINRFTTVLPSGRVKTYAYVRYFFSNLSSDIRAIFIDHCELLGIRVTQPNPRNLSVSHRDSVELLEAIVGPKS